MKHRIVSALALCATLGFAATALASTSWFAWTPLQTVTGTGVGDSCAFFSPKKKAIAEAENNAFTDALADCNNTNAQCNSACLANGAYEGERTLVDATFTTTTSSPSCGFHADSRVVAHCGCLCWYDL